MNSRFKIDESLCNCRGFFIIKPITLTSLFILTLFHSCIKQRDENLTRVEGNVIDIISKEKLSNTEIQILEWHQFWLSGGLYSIPKESAFTDANGHFQINYSSNPKYNYTLGISRDLYFKEDGFNIPLPSDNVNLGIFPQGFINTHITNKIDSVRFIEVNFTPFYLSQPFFREDFVNFHLFAEAFPDTSFFTTTLGGVTNNLTISLHFDDTVKTVTDTTFLTQKHDTVKLKNIIFF